MQRLSPLLLPLFAMTALATLPTGVLAEEAVPPHLEQALALYGSGDVDRAQSLLEQRLKDRPDDAWAAYYLGKLRFDAGDVEAALERFESAVETDPRVSDFHLWLGRAYLQKLQSANMFKKLGLSKQVRASYLSAIEIDPDNFEARESLAGYYFEAPGIAGGSTEKGMEQVEAIRARDPRLAHRVMGSHYTGKEKYDLAEQEFQAALALAPEDADTLFGLGLLYQSMERYDDAFGVFEKMMALDEANMDAHYQLGRTASLSGRNLDRGVECMQVYLGHTPKPGDPSLAWAHYRLGLIYTHQGDKAAARREYEAALKQDPNHEQAKKALKQR